MELNDEEMKRWPFLIQPPMYGRYPSLSPWSFQRPYQQSLSGLLYPTLSQPQNPWESSEVTNDYWKIQIPAQWSYTTTTSFPVYDVPQLRSTPPLPQGRREQPVVGYRAWRLESIQHLGRLPQPILHSTGVRHDWKQGVNVAQCLGGLLRASHVSPAPQCECGFWVFSSLDGLEQHIQGINYDVVGAVMGWGTVVQHGETGWRAQYAKVIALLDLKAGRKSAEQTKEVAKQYSLPVFERDALELVVNEHDGRLPLEAP